MFDGTLGSYNGPDYKIELKEGIKPYHAKPLPIRRVHDFKKRSRTISKNRRIEMYK